MSQKEQDFYQQMMRKQYSVMHPLGAQRIFRQTFCINMY